MEVRQPSFMTAWPATWPYESSVATTVMATKPALPSRRDVVVISTRTSFVCSLRVCHKCNSVAGVVQRQLRPHQNDYTNMSMCKQVDPCLWPYRFSPLLLSTRQQLSSHSTTNPPNKSFTSFFPTHAEDKHEHLHTHNPGMGVHPQMTCQLVAFTQITHVPGPPTPTPHPPLNRRCGHTQRVGCLCQHQDS